MRVRHLSMLIAIAIATAAAATSRAQQNDRASPQAAPQPGNMWYFCDEAKAYYPYVKTCPAGWQQVTPQPQG